MSTSDDLFAAIAHGDEAHRAWLKTELDKFFASRSEKPIGWSYDLATGIVRHEDKASEYTGFIPRISFHLPNVPENSIRNLTALYLVEVRRLICPECAKAYK